MTTTSVRTPAPVERASGRVILVDAADRVLLLQCGPADPVSSGVWLTPGGGLEAGETSREAAARELAEETGLDVPAASLTGPVWIRRFPMADLISLETFFFLRVDAHTVDTSGFTELERRVLVADRWWSLPELAAATEERFAPRDIARLLAALLTDTSGPPIELVT